MNDIPFYRMTYRCRMCGREFSYIATYYDGAIEIATDLVYENESTREINTPHGATTERFRRYQTHICPADGSIGLGDFVGFQKVRESE